MFVLPGFLLSAIAVAQPALVCRVDGLKAIPPAVTSQNVCARFKTAIEKQVGEKMQLATAAPAGEGDWIRVDIRFSRADTATASLSQRRRGKTIAYTPQSISVSDRKIDLLMVEQLAHVVAAQIKLR